MEGTAFELYLRLNYFPVEEAQRLFGKLPLPCEHRLRVLELGSGLGSYTVPLLRALQNTWDRGPIAWAGYERCWEHADLLLHLLRTLKVEEWTPEAIRRAVGNRRVRPEPQGALEHRDGNCTLSVRTRDVEELALAGNDWTEEDPVHLLVAPFFYHHTCFWPLVVTGTLARLTSPGVLLLGVAGGDWLLHDGLLASYRTPEGEETREFSAWRRFWGALGQQGVRVSRVLSAASPWPVIGLARALGYEVENAGSAESRNEVRLSVAELRGWILSRSASVWRRVRMCYDTDDEFREVVETAISKAFGRDQDTVTMRSSNSILGFRIARRRS